MSAPRLHIIMPCARPENVPAILESLLTCEPHPFELRWHVAMQGPEEDPKGIRKVNEALDDIQDGWIWCFADDSLVHPRMFRRLGEVIAGCPTARAIVLSEERRDGLGVLHAHPDNMRPFGISGDQYVLHRSLIGQRRYNYRAYGDRCDGMFIARLYQDEKAAFVFVDEVLVWFNRLRWEVAA